MHRREGASGHVGVAWRSTDARTSFDFQLLNATSVASSTFLTYTYPILPLIFSMRYIGTVTPHKVCQPCLDGARGQRPRAEPVNRYSSVRTIPVDARRLLIITSDISMYVTTHALYAPVALNQWSSWNTASSGSSSWTLERATSALMRVISSLMPPANRISGRR